MNEPVEVKLSHPEKVLYPRDGITKQDIADYFDAVASAMIPTLRDRPLAFQHWPQGIHRPPWFQQNIGDDAEPWMHLVETPTSTSQRMVRHLVADRPEALRWLAQHNALTLHMWSSREGSLESPDWVVFDLDPGEGHGFEQTLDVAFALRKWLEAHDIASVPKTSGKRGLHVFVPLAPGQTHEEAIAFAVSVGQELVPTLPQTTMLRSKAQRHGRLYFDCYQNGYGKTVVAPYTPREVDAAPVSAPLKWSEVTRKLDPKKFTVKTMPKRIEKVGDLFADALKGGIELKRFR
jgi:bifunctional non-homologous end joining protein LigD